MDEINYLGEHLLPRELGHIFIILNFTAALFAGISFYLAAKRNENKNLKTLGRTFFSVHSFSLFAIIGLIFFVMFNRYYEYMYAFEHVSNDLASQYMLSAFWEGQEGSFLLWMFWHAILGMILMRKAGKWESGVLAVLAIIQAWLATMLLGIYLPIGEGIKIGSNPLILLREVSEAPIFMQAEYLGLIKDGNGLNILLQNYWMTIHPPTLFLGFALASVPFCYAIAALIKKDYTDWLKAVKPWTLVCCSILGLGILMGAAWAYESLTFGGYWAWDPVENMSLVPWLMMIAGLHAHLIAQSTGHALRGTFVFYILSFFLVLYSTYLTRSGALQETSVHAFTEMGMGSQLTVFILFFLIAPFLFLIPHWKRIPNPVKEEKTSSREFWMFVGLMILAISSILITYSTSLPLVNKLVQVFNPDYVDRVIEDAVTHYNKYQIWIAFFIALLSGFAQWLTYKKEKWSGNQWWRRIGLHACIAVVLTILVTFFLQSKPWQVVALVFASWYCLISNIDYLIMKLFMRWKMAASIFSHVGFSLLLLGVVLSGINKRHITRNLTLAKGLLSDVPEGFNLSNVILLKDAPIFSQGYEMNYTSDSLEKTTMTYHVDVVKLDEEGQKTNEQFALNPTVIFNDDMDGIAAYNPSIKRGVTQDIFSRISSLPHEKIDLKLAREFDDALKYQPHRLYVGEPIHVGNKIIELVAFNQARIGSTMQTSEGDKILQAEIRVTDTVSEITSTGKVEGVLRDQLSYIFPSKYQEELVRIKMADSAFAPYVQHESPLLTEPYELKVGETINHENIEVKLESIQPAKDEGFYFKQPGDIAVEAKLAIKQNSQQIAMKPKYIIRENRVVYSDAISEDLGQLFRFTKLNPTTEVVTLQMASFKSGLPMLIADQVPRTDFIALEAFKFPGINLVWLGSLLMLFGFLWSFYFRRK